MGGDSIFLPPRSKLKISPTAFLRANYGRPYPAEATSMTSTQSVCSPGVGDMKLTLSPRAIFPALCDLPLRGLNHQPFNFPLASTLVRTPKGRPTGA